MSCILIAVGFFTAGTGTVAILAAATALTLSAYEAFKAYKEFEQARAAHSVKFLSEEPTFFWVVVALMGAKLNLKVLGKIGVKQALQTFQKSRHVKNLVDDLRRIGFSDEEIAAIRKGADNEIMGLTPQKINPNSRSLQRNQLKLQRNQMSLQRNQMSLQRK